MYFCETPPSLMKNESVTPIFKSPFMFSHKVALRGNDRWDIWGRGSLSE